MDRAGALLERWIAAVDARIGARAAWRWLADERIRGGARWAYVLGSILAFLLLSQALSGVVLSLGYAPTVDAAHDSVSRLSDQGASAWGPLVRGLHHHGATFIVLALVAHLVQVALFGAYRKPREGNWITGLLAGFVVFGFAFTGYLLPWDQTAFYATRVGLNIARSVPLVGPATADLLQGGPVLGNLTLTRFYTIHVIVLPAALAALVGAHLALFRRHGVTPPAGVPPEELEARAQRFWPHQALRDVLSMGFVFVLLLGVAAALPAELGAEADPSQPFNARPEWYFLWLFQLLHYFEPPLEWMGTLVIPGLLVTLLVLLPWIDRSPDRLLRGRKLPLGALAAALVLVIGLTLQVVIDDLRAGDATEAEVETIVAAATAPSGSVDAGTLEAAMLYGMHCGECHGVQGEPIDPDATDFRTEDFAAIAKSDFEHLVEMITLGGEMMPAIDELSEEQARLIARRILVGFADRVDDTSE